MSKPKSTSRRTFLQSGILASAGLALANTPLRASAASKEKENKRTFTLWQIPSHADTIGNSYILKTCEGRIIVMDGGFKEEANTLRGFIGALGNEVEAWFISHPHNDHMGALNEILKNPQDLKINAIYHSRLSEKVIKAEAGSEQGCREFYGQLDRQKDIRVVDIRKPGAEFDFDGMKLRIVSVANDITKNAYNNSSMIIRVWDKKKSIVFLGDAGIECGDLALKGPYAADLNCDYLQMAHHGQNGCSESFYRSIKFRVCLWPTPSWVWNNDQGRGFNTGILKTFETRLWMDRIGIKEHHVTCREGLFKLI